MDIGEIASTAAIASILLIVILSGPVLPVIDLTTSAFQPALTDDVHSNFTITDVTIESGAPEITTGPARWQAVLDAPEISVEIGSVTGSPLLVYQLAVFGLGHNVVTIVLLNEGDVGRTLSLDIENSSLRRSDITEPSYPGEIELRVRSENESTTLFRQNVTVVVENFDDT